MDGYRPETKQEKKERLKKRAEARAEGGKDTPTKKKNVVRHGANTVTTLVEKKKAQLVVIANDVDPIEVIIQFSGEHMRVVFCFQWWNKLLRISSSELFDDYFLWRFLLEIRLWWNHVSKYILTKLVLFQFSVSFVLACFVQKDGRPILHRQKQGSTRQSCPQEDHHLLGHHQREYYFCYLLDFLRKILWWEKYQSQSHEIVMIKPIILISEKKI